jgi:SHAQKYF class myb-like DNA-binding protein
MNTIVEANEFIANKPEKENGEEDKINAKEKESSNGNGGRWTKEEHELFLEALKLYGKDWKKVQEVVGTRTTTQARSHAQKYFAKCEKIPNKDRAQSYQELEKVTRESYDGQTTQTSTPVVSPLEKGVVIQEKHSPRREKKRIGAKRKITSLNDNPVLPKKNFKQDYSENLNELFHCCPNRNFEVITQNRESKQDNSIILNDGYSLRNECDSYLPQIVEATTQGNSGTRRQSFGELEIPDFEDFRLGESRPLDLTSREPQGVEEAPIVMQRVFSADLSEIPEIIQNYR